MFFFSRSCVFKVLNASCDKILLCLCRVEDVFLSCINQPDGFEGCVLLFFSIFFFERRFHILPSCGFTNTFLSSLSVFPPLLIPKMFSIRSVEDKEVVSLSFFLPLLPLLRCFLCSYSSVFCLCWQLLCQKLKKSKFEGEMLEKLGRCNVLSLSLSNIQICLFTQTCTKVYAWFNFTSFSHSLILFCHMNDLWDVTQCNVQSYGKQSLK